MTIDYNFTNDFNEKDINFLSNYGFKVEKGYDSLKISTSNPNFNKIRDYFGEKWDRNSFATIKYTKSEIENSKYFEIHASKQLGYAKPDVESIVDTFEYPFDIYPYYKGVFEISKTDPNYGVLRGKQIGSYQMKGKPKWGKSQIGSFFNTTDSFFTTPDTFKLIFEPLGIDSLPVIDFKNKKEVDGIVQILQQGVSKSPLNLKNKNYIKEQIVVKNFGITKYILNSAYPPPPFLENPGDMDFFYTQEYFGSGGLTQRSTIISKKLYQLLRENKIKGLNYSPLIENLNLDL